MPAENVKEFLDEQGVRYWVMDHPTAYTSQEVAHAAHISGKELAKAVVVAIDDELALAVVRADRLIDLEALKEEVGADEIRIATEIEFHDRFPGCEVGAIPPFGALGEMDTFVDEDVINVGERIAFCAGTHHELTVLDYEDFEFLSEPIYVKIT